MNRNHTRSFRLIRDAIKCFSLDLTGLVVLTEAASGNYIYTPLIAALANATKVYAITNDSKYGKSSDVIEETYRLAESLNIRNRIEIITNKPSSIIKQADIITNLGFVRPINRQMIEFMKSTAVIPFMYEPWEYRKEDIDIEICKKRDILVIGTNEDHPKLEVFNFCGILSILMLFKMEIEVYNNKIVIVSSDKFGEVIKKNIDTVGAEVYLVDDLKSELNKRHLKNSDAVIIADYRSNDLFIGPNGHISAEELCKFSQGISVIQFTGNVDIDELDKFNIPYFPKRRIGNFRMGMTLAELGPKPVIDLHCAGLRVGEVMAKCRKKGLNIQETIDMTLQSAPGMTF